ncbi:unnamed protein product [Heterosigma akashiwo]
MSQVLCFQLVGPCLREKIGTHQSLLEDTYYKQMARPLATARTDVEYKFSLFGWR